jgi:hypothetical protein
VFCTYSYPPRIYLDLNELATIKVIARYVKTFILVVANDILASSFISEFYAQYVQLVVAYNIGSNL